MRVTGEEGGRRDRGQWVALLPTKPARNTTTKQMVDAERPSPFGTKGDASKRSEIAGACRGWSGAGRTPPIVPFVQKCLLAAPRRAEPRGRPANQKTTSPITTTSRNHCRPFRGTKGARAQRAGYARGGGAYQPNTDSNAHQPTRIPKNPNSHLTFMPHMYYVNK